jgi:hypothetical protein
LPSALESGFAEQVTLGAAVSVTIKSTQWVTLLQAPVTTTQ